MARLIPNPLGDVLGKAELTLEQVDTVLERVEGTLVEVSGTLAEAAEVLGEVRDLLVVLRDRLELLDQVPVMAAQLAEVHAAVVGGAAGGSATRPRKQAASS